MATALRKRPDVIDLIGLAQEPSQSAGVIVNRLDRRLLSGGQVTLHPIAATTFQPKVF